MGATPNLSASHTERYVIAADGLTLLPPENNPPQDFWWSGVALIPRDEVTINPISNIAKLDASGNPLNKWPYELPPMAIVGILQEVYHVRGIAYKNQFPFKLKALGRVSAAQIQQRLGTLVSNDYVIVP